MGEAATRNLPIVSKQGEFHPIGSCRGYPDIPRCGSCAIPAPLDPDRLAVTLAALADTHQVPGAQLAVYHGGATVAVEVGELKHAAGIPVTRDTAFPIGSISKAWIATLAMILVADGDIELDAPLDEHLPELHDLGGELTLCQLLSHTSGFASSPDTPELSTLSLGRYVRKHCRWQGLILPPGSAFSYSSRNHVLAAYLIETITRMSWSEAVESILLRPLGIDFATVVAPARARYGRPMATGHSVNTAVGRTRSVEQPVVPAEAPAAGLAMSAVDLVALGLMHVGPGFPQLLPAVHAERMRQAVPGAEPFGLAEGWGPGLAIFGGETTTWVGHDGNASGTSCYLRIDPVGECVVALTTSANTGSSLWEELRLELDLATPLPAPYRCGSVPRVSGVEAAQFVGSYSNGPTEYLITAENDTDLFLEIGGDRVARLAFYNELEFLIQDPASGQGQHVGRFLRDPSTKQVEQLQIGGRLALRRPPAVPEARSPADSICQASA
ncbi:MAG: serine hydrolase domain-containing protein [Pseudonocardiaceae bacterium]